ncbi:MAG TPA: hypothetical protein VFR47_26730 [Anaerolineales bacterium]|nr:hypothetical protein [Anaerolineales bacterium]
MAVIARSRSSNNLHVSPDLKSRVIEILAPNDPVEILEDLGEMVKVSSRRLSPPLHGYMSKAAVAQRIPNLNIFSPIQLDNGTQLDSVPADLLAIEFESWLQARGEPTWLFEDGNAPFLVGDKLRAEFELFREAWTEWFSEVLENNRTRTATMNEWFTVLNGGREMWSFRPERIFLKPTENSAGIGWASPKDILHWNGRVAYTPTEWKYKEWCEVELTKFGKTIKGWYKAALLEEFVLPEVYVEANDRTAIAALFDMSRPRVRIPADPEIADAIKAQRHAPQYINVLNAIRKNKVNYNLCGQFCVAAVCGVDVIPLLKKWYQTGLARAKTVLENDRGTVIYDLQNMLSLYNLKSELFRPEPSIAPATPMYLEKMLKSGKIAIIGTGITRTGEISINASIRHWLVITDIVRMGNGGWVRVYNGYFNQEEVYPYRNLFDMGISSSLGLWVETLPSGAI